jgi:signal transduction histidine kinase
MVRALFSAPAASRWELAAESIAIKIRWFGLVVGYWVANGTGRDPAHLPELNAILGLGLAYALADTYYRCHGRLFVLARYPLVLSLLEAVFITLLCHFDTGLNSPFRHYYLLSLLVGAIRYPLAVPYVACIFHCVGYSLLYFALAEPPQDGAAWLMTLVVMVWVTWAASAMALLLKRAGAELHKLNAALQNQQAVLEERIAERTRELHETQAYLLHQEKMAAFGLLAAGIAHEVGNPLTSISSLVQILQRRTGDGYVQEKLALVSGQLDRIQTTLRELINFSRPASNERVWVDVAEVVQDALNIAKYYQRTRSKPVMTRLDAGLPRLFVVRQQVAQALLNLVLNAIDATAKNGVITVVAAAEEAGVRLEVQDDGPPIATAHLPRLFSPYFTTKAHGTGLGLFMTEKLVAENGGRVGYDQPPGRPKAFRIHFPLPTEHHVAAPDDTTGLVAAGAP